VYELQVAFGLQQLMFAVVKVVPAFAVSQYWLSTAQGTADMDPHLVTSVSQQVAQVVEVIDAEVQ
jgi:hypothetical protein